MKQWQKECLIFGSIFVILTVAFWWGGNSAELHGWGIGGHSEQPAKAEKIAVPVFSAYALPAPQEERSFLICPKTGGNSSQIVEQSQQGTQRPDAESTAQPSATPTPNEERTQTPTAPVTEQAVVTEPPQTVPEKTEKPQPCCSFEVTCTEALECADLPQNIRELLPQDGILLRLSDVRIEENETVFDLLQRLLREAEIPLEFSVTPIYRSCYIEGIGNLYEFDCGEQSGWIYSVNGSYPEVGCSQVVLHDGDRVCFCYTCKLGEAVGR